MRRRLGMFLILGGLALAKQPCQVNPTECVRGYYTFVQQGAWDDAHSLLSSQADGQLTQSNFSVLWTNTIQVKPSHLVLYDIAKDQAAVNLQVDSLEVDPKSGQRSQRNYQVKALLKKTGGLWIIDSLQPRLVRSTPFNGLEIGNFYVPVKKGSARPLPDEVPIYPGFTLSPPMLVTRRGDPARINLVSSRNRIPHLLPEKVVAFYTQKLTAAGWTTEGPAGGSSCQEINFLKAGLRLNVHAYQGIVDGTDAPLLDPKGTKLDLVYARE